MLGHARCQTCLEQGWEETRPPSATSARGGHLLRPGGHGWTWRLSPKAISVPITLPLRVFWGQDRASPRPSGFPASSPVPVHPGTAPAPKKGCLLSRFLLLSPGRQISAEFGLLALPSLARNSPAVTLWPLFHSSSVRPAVTCPSEGIPGVPAHEAHGAHLEKLLHGWLQLPGWDFGTKHHKSARNEDKEQGHQDGHQKRRMGCGTAEGSTKTWVPCPAAPRGSTFGPTVMLSIQKELPIMALKNATCFISTCPPGGRISKFPGRLNFFSPGPPPPRGRNARRVCAEP